MNTHGPPNWFLNLNLRADNKHNNRLVKQKDNDIGTDLTASNYIR